MLLKQYNTSMMPLIERQILENICILRLNRPSVRNALSQELRQALMRHFYKLKEDNSIRAIVLTGAGKAFCAGLDLAELDGIRQKTEADNRADSQALAELFSLIYSFPKPVIAALNGHAVAGGAGLATVCDLIIMSDAAKIGYTESRIGFVPALVSVFLLRQIGEKHARDLLLSARLISAPEALNMGLVNEVHTQHEVLDRAIELANQVSKNAPGSLALTKKLLDDLPGLSRKEGLLYASEINTQARSSAELKEGIAAFLEKREPSWQDS